MQPKLVGDKLEVTLTVSEGKTIYRALRLAETMVACNQEIGNLLADACKEVLNRYKAWPKGLGPDEDLEAEDEG